MDKYESAFRFDPPDLANLIEGVKNPYFNTERRGTISESKTPDFNQKNAV